MFPFLAPVCFHPEWTPEFRFPVLAPIFPLFGFGQFDWDLMTPTGLMNEDWIDNPFLEETQAKETNTMMSKISLKVRRGTCLRTKRSMLKVVTKLWTIIRSESPKVFIPRSHTLGEDGKTFLLRSIVRDLTAGKTVRFFHWDGTEGSISPDFAAFYRTNESNPLCDLWFWLGEYLEVK